MIREQLDLFGTLTGKAVPPKPATSADEPSNVLPLRREARG